MIDRLALGLLIAGCILFGGILAAEVIEAPPAGTEAIAVNNPTRGETVGAAARAEPAVAPVERVAEILARPLFSSTRRPSLHSSGPATDSGLSDTRLTGIVTEPGHRFAIFAITGAKPLIVTEGDTVGGWRVDNITPRDVSLSGPEGTRTLQPKLDPNLIPPPPPPMPAVSSATVRPAAAIGPRAPVPPLLPNRAPFRPGQWPVRQ
jgi:hypothetical protein